MIWIIMPTGPNHGWGVCGKYLTLEMSDLTGVGLITDNLESELKNDPIHYATLSQMSTDLDQLREIQNPKGVYHFRQPVLQTIRGADLKPWHIDASAQRIVGYTFFEQTALHGNDISRARGYYDWVVAGSSWCETILRDRGLRNCSTILQGIDQNRFHSGYAFKKEFEDRFVIFSGGKLELRKGQDLVIRAFKVLQERYDDVLLINCWHNMWDESTMTLQMSPHIRFEMPPGDYFNAVNHLLRINGVDPEGVVVLPPTSNSRMAEIYRNTDCGLFPNRCEGGTNLVLMEYMACGKPAIASFNSGQTDVLSSDHAILLEDQRPLNITQPDGTLYTTWNEPNLEEIVDRLDWAYNHRDEIREIGLRGGKFMSRLTWEKAAREFHALMFNGSPLQALNPEDKEFKPGDDRHCLSGESCA